jgi:hypothetical protein
MAPADPPRLNERARTTVLVVGTDDWAVERAATALASADIDVLRCQEVGEPSFPCNAFIEGRVCPIDAGFDVVLTARARPARSAEPREVGVVCALRAGRPLVVAGVTVGNPFASVATTTVGEGGDAAEACRAAAHKIEAADPEAAVVDTVDLRRQAGAPNR